MKLIVRAQISYIKHNLNHFSINFIKIKHFRPFPETSYQDVSVRGLLFILLGVINCSIKKDVIAKEKIDFISLLT